MKNLITALLLTSSMAATASSNEFTPKQLQQVDEVRTSALNSHLSYELLESLTTEVGPRLPGTETTKKPLHGRKLNLKNSVLTRYGLKRRRSQSGAATAKVEKY